MSLLRPAEGVCNGRAADCQDAVDHACVHPLTLPCPSSMPACSPFKTLNVQQQKLGGPLPEEFGLSGSFPNLINLLLQQNSFTGGQALRTPRRRLARTITRKAMRRPAHCCHCCPCQGSCQGARARRCMSAEVP